MHPLPNLRKEDGVPACTPSHFKDGLESAPIKINLPGTKPMDMSLFNSCYLLELIIDEWSIDMNKQLKKLILVVMTIPLLAACGRFKTTPADVPELSIIESPTSTPASVVISEPTEDILTAVPSDGAALESLSPYIGMSYPPFPTALSQDLSMVIQNSDGYGLWLVNDGANKMLWLSKITRYDANGNSFWEVKDVLALSDLETGLTLHPDGCLLNSTPDSEIIVAGRNGVIVLAWRANTSLDRFEVMDTDGIQCNSDKAVNIT